MAGDPWAAFPDAPKAAPAGKRDQWDAFPDHPSAAAGAPLAATGQAHDGDTLRLSDGSNGRVFGIDAFELNQTGVGPDGRPVPLGVHGRDWLRANLGPQTRISPTGAKTYNRPVVTLDNNGQDLALGELGAGWALSEPDYLRSGDPQRFVDYTQAEREARMNRRGAFSSDFVKPSAFRHGGALPADPSAPDPWQQAEWHSKPHSGDVAVFWDEPTPFQGLKPDVATGYIGVWNDPRSTPADMLAFARKNGFTLSPSDVSKRYKARNAALKAGAPIGSEIQYSHAPRILINPGDGAGGAFGRGLADPLNTLDEEGAFADTFGLTKGRESMFNSDRRFADIYYNNLEQNREILGYDDEKHPWARTGGQFAGALVLPGGAIEGVGLKAATQTLRAGGTRMMAEAAAKSAIRQRLALAGGVEGAVAGFGGGDNMHDRLVGAAQGGVTGYGAGLGTATLAQAIVARFGSRGRKLAASAAEDAAAAEPAPPASPAAPVEAAAPIIVVPHPSDPSIPRRADRIDVGRSSPAPIAPADGSGPIFPETPRAYPRRDLSEVNPEIEQWAAQRGINPAAAGGGMPDTMLHGSPRGNIDSFDPYGRSGYGLFGMGTYLTDHPGVAAGYTAKGARQLGDDAHPSIYAVQHTVRNPLDMDAPADVAAWERVAGDYTDFEHGMTNEQAFRAVEEGLSDGTLPKWEGAEIMDGVVRGLGHDGITHVGGGRHGKGDGPSHRVVIALDPEQTTITDRLSVRDLTDPRRPDVLAMKAGDGRSQLYMPAPLRGHVPEGEAAAPVRPVDRMDVGQGGGVAPAEAGKPYPMLAEPTEAQRAAQAQDIRPGDVMPLADSSVGSMDEAAAIGAGKYAPVKAPNERDALASRSIPSPNDGLRTIPKRGPLDLVTWLRTQGGIKPQGGELTHYGIDNAPRAGMDFAGGENRFGKLVDGENGMTYDEAAQRAHEAGYFPDHVERPTTSEFLDALNATHNGRNRHFLPEDYPEIDAFHAARAQRHAVEGAREEGTPLVQDRGEPVQMDDLEANTPPVHAYEEWGDQAPNYAGNLKLGNLDSPQSIKRALSVTAQRVGGFDAATRGRITHAETAALASEMGMTPAQLLSRRKGQAFNAEEALAARQILAKSGNELVNMARKISRFENPGDELMAQFRHAWTRHVAIQEQVAGMTAEAGRALQQFRQMADSRAVRGEVLHSLAEGPFGPDQMRKAADAIVENADNPAALNRAALKAARAPFKDKLIELYYNSILSGPQTHAVNAMSNTMTALGQIPEHAVAAVIGAPRALARSAGAADRVLFSELGARMAGMLQGTKEGMAQAARTFRTGRTPDHVNKIEGAEAAAISGIKGKIIRVPTRALSAADELYKAIARRSEIAGLAVRQAGKEGLQGQAARARAAALTANPTDEMVRQSFDYARYVTFQRPLESKFGKGLTRLSEGSIAIKLVLPFVRTPANIMKFAVERSPAAPLLGAWRADMLAGGARRDLAIAKVAVGTGAMATAMQLYSQGLITGGGPADPAAKAVMRADGWQPYSVKIGDKYYSYQRLDPYATTLGVAADFADLQSHMTEHQRDEAASLLLASTIKNLADKTWFSGVSDLTHAVTDSDRYGEAYLRNRFASTVVPSVVAQSAKAYDDTMRAPRTFLDALRARLPIWSQDVPGRLDVWGRTVANEGGVGPNIISPVWQSRSMHDPVNAAVLETGARVSLPGRYVGGKQLEDDEYHAFAQASGKLAHERVNDLITRPSWSSIPAERRGDAIEDAVRAARTEVRTRMFGPRGARAKAASATAATTSAAPRSAGGYVPTSFDDPMFKDAH